MQCRTKESHPRIIYTIKMQCRTKERHPNIFGFILLHSVIICQKIRILLLRAHVVKATVRCKSVFDSDYGKCY